MSKSVMISIKPAWCEKIVSGEKTIEVRKSVPKLELPFKVYIYCTKDIMVKDNGWKGKVIGEFTCDRIIDGQEVCGSELPNTALNRSAIICYGNGCSIYGWHISDLVVYDTPKLLEDFSTPRMIKFGVKLAVLNRPPQSWCYVEETSGMPSDAISPDDEED